MSAKATSMSMGMSIMSTMDTKSTSITIIMKRVA